MSIFEKVKIFFEKKEEIMESRSLSLDELEEWIEKELKKEEERGVDECNPIIQEIEEIRGDALRIIKEIDEREFSENIEKRMYKPVKTAKPIFVKGMREALRRIKTGDLQDYEDRLSYQKSLVNCLKSIDSLQRGTGRHVAFVYREDMPKLGTELNSLINLSNKLNDILEERRDKLNALEDIFSNLKEIKTQNKNKLETITKRKVLAKKKNNLKREKSALRKKLDTLEKEDAFQQFLSIQEEVEAQKEERKKLMGSIYNQLHPLKRVFKKFKRLVETGNFELKKEDIAKLRSYIDDPRQTFLSEDKQEPALLNILKGARESIINGGLQLKAKEKSKVMNKITHLEKNCLEMMKEHDKINSKEKSLIDKLSGFKVAGRRDELQKKEEGIEYELEDLDRKKIDLDKEKIEREKKIKTLLKDVEALASDIMGQGIKIHEEALLSEEY